MSPKTYMRLRFGRKARIVRSLRLRAGAPLPTGFGLLRIRLKHAALGMPKSSNYGLLVPIGRVMKRDKALHVAHFTVQTAPWVGVIEISILCRIFGHRPRFGWCHQEREGYMDVRVGSTDGIGRVHASLYSECERCGKTFKVGNIHVPNAWEKRS